MCVYVGAWVHKCVCVRACVLACVHMHPQYSPLKMHINTMRTSMITQTMITPHKIPTTTGTNEDGALGQTVFIQYK